MIVPINGWFNKELKVINVTSTFPSEGKTFTVLNLAQVYAQTHQKVLIVDLDLRTLYLNDLEMHGCTVYDPAVFQSLIEYIEKEKVTPIIGGVFRLEEIREAQEEFSKKSC